VSGLWRKLRCRWRSALALGALLTESRCGIYPFEQIVTVVTCQLPRTEVNLFTRVLVFASCLAIAVGCSSSGATNQSGYGGAGGATSEPPDAGFSGTGAGGSGLGGAGGVLGGAGGSGGTVPPDAPPPYDPDAGFIWPEAEDAGKCQAGTYSGTYECQVVYGAQTFPITGQVSFALQPSASGEFLEIKDGKLNANVVEFGVTMTGDLVGKLECLTNQFSATIQNGNYTFALFPLPNPFDGTLAGALDRLTATMTGQWFLMGQAPVGFAAPACSGPWRVTRQP
jgi:hypothetical protein